MRVLLNFEKKRGRHRLKEYLKQAVVNKSTMYLQEVRSGKTRYSLIISDITMANANR
jgi:hypothetical protein